MSKAKSLGYWGTTSVVALLMISGGVFQVLGNAGATDGITSLGYPLYFVTILGVWKALGGVAILLPRTPRLKEWAYAGIVFDLTGAAASHVAMHSHIGHVVWTLGLAALALASWALRPERRILGSLAPKAAG